MILAGERQRQLVLDLRRQRAVLAAGAPLDLPLQLRLHPLRSGSTRTVMVACFPM